MPVKGNGHSRHLNMCPSCSSLSDGMTESEVSRLPDFADKKQAEGDFHPVMAEPVTALAHS
jgi:hypothetical protein